VKTPNGSTASPASPPFSRGGGRLISSGVELFRLFLPPRGDFFGFGLRVGLAAGLVAGLPRGLFLGDFFPFWPSSLGLLLGDFPFFPPPLFLGLDPTAGDGFGLVFVIIL